MLEQVAFLKPYMYICRFDLRIGLHTWSLYLSRFEFWQSEETVKRFTGVHLAVKRQLVTMFVFIYTTGLQNERQGQETRVKNEFSLYSIATQATCADGNQMENEDLSNN